MEIRPEGDLTDMVCVVTWIYEKIKSTLPKNLIIRLLEWLWFARLLQLNSGLISQTGHCLVEFSCENGMSTSREPPVNTESM